MSSKNETSSPLPKNRTLVTSVSIIKKHIDAICDLETGSFDPPWNRSDFVNELESGDSHGMILLENDTLTGYLFAKKAVDEIHINKLCIHPGYRGRGNGKLLLSNFISRMEGRYSRMFLEVESTNAAAVRLYTGKGFRVNRIRKAIYASGADAIEMVLGGE